MHTVMRQYYSVSAEHTRMFNQYQLQPKLDQKKMLDKQKNPLSIKQRNQNLMVSLGYLNQHSREGIRSSILQLLRKIKPPYERVKTVVKCKSNSVKFLPNSNCIKQSLPSGRY